MTSTHAPDAVQPAPSARHLAGLPPVPTIATPGFRKTQSAAADAVELREIALVAGNPGLGKSFAVHHFVTHQPLPWLWLDMPPKPTPKEVVVRLLRATVGSCNSNPPVYELADELCTVLAEEPRVIVIDEAQNLDSHGLHQIRYLHDRLDADWGLLFVGGAGCEKVLASDPQLDDRIAGRVAFRPLTPAELADELCTVLAEEPRVIVIDEAQNLDSHGLHQIRYLHDRLDADWGLLFVGGAGCEKVLASDPQLDDRIAGRVAFRPLTPAELLETLTAYSPFFAHADRQLLLRLDETYAHGVFRRWARVLQVGSRLAAAAGTDRLTLQVARAALARLKTETA